MFGIGEFFKRVQGTYSKEILLRTNIVSAIKKLTGAEIGLDNIILKSGVVTLNGVSQALKSTVYIKKQAILKEINERQVGTVIKDMR